ncbi:MAG TPA: alpha/beta hydrolase [Solirubrobacteraceae bacterium]|nr:alpha/beta hydrolase [Solirubrobacteraceae bacterium]
MREITIAASHRGGSGEPLVLVHGYTGSWRNWVPVLPALEACHDVLAVGLAGHHCAAPLREGAEPSVHELADAIERDMDAAGFETAHVAGNSLGGYLALELGARGRARSVVALSPSGGYEPGSAAERKIFAWFVRQHRIGRKAMPHLERVMARPGLRRLALRDVMRHGERVPPAEAVAMSVGALECAIREPFMEWALREAANVELGSIACPVLIAWAERDRILPMKTCSARLREAAPGAEWRVLPGVGHVPMYDDPDLIARTIVDFAAAAEARRAAPAAQVSA